MAKGFKHGAGGESLNFSVKAYPSETELMANNPKENTIGVITTTTISGWNLTPEEPSAPEVGMVWIDIGTSSTVAFSATKKNPIMVYPLSAKQYVGGAWVDKTAKSYQNGEWVDWIPSGALYWNGDECTTKTGGWGASPKYPNGTVNKYDTYIEFYGTVGVTPGTLTHATPITPSGKKLFVVISVTNISGNDVVIFSSDSGGSNKMGQITVTSDCTEKQFEIPLDNAQNVSGYVFLNANGNAKMRLHRAWFE